VLASEKCDRKNNISFVKTYLLQDGMKDKTKGLRDKYKLNYQNQCNSDCKVGSEGVLETT